METCGKAPDVWTYDDVKAKIDMEAEAGAMLALPLATIVETGNHIAQLNNNRRPYAEDFAKILRASVDDENPWTAFSAQMELWNEENLRNLAEKFVDFAERGLGIGDATILDVANFYASAGHYVEILTGDGSLKGYEPAPPPNPFRRDRR